MNETHKVASDANKQRLDIWCVSKLPDYSRAAIQKAIKNGEITVNEQVVKPRYEVKTGDAIAINIIDKTDQSPIPPPPDLPILFETPDVVVVNKPAGITSHPAPGNRAPTVSDWFAKRYPDSASIGDSHRPGIIHRLDKDTTGVLVLAKTPTAFEQLKRQFKRHRVRKEYLALVFGVPGARHGRITRPIGRSPRNPQRRTVMDKAAPRRDEVAFRGKPAITEWKREETFGNNYSLLRLFPFTGRTHQLRVHLHFIGHPIIGDPLYTFKRQSSPPGVIRQLLHAASITISLPDGKKKTIQAPLPEDFQTVLEKLRK